MKLVCARFGAQVHHATGKLAPLSTQVVVLNFELTDRILGRNNNGEIDIADVEGLTIQILRTLICKRPTNLVIAPTKRVLAHWGSTGTTLSDRRRRDRDQVEDVASVQRQLIGFALFHDLAQ